MRSITTNIQAAATTGTDMPADASIYNALMRPQKSVFDYANDFTNQRQGQQLNALQIRAAEQAAADDAAFRSALGSGGDFSTPEGQMRLYQAAPKAAGAYFKNQADIAKERAAAEQSAANARKITQDTNQQARAQRASFIASFPTPESAAQSIQQAVTSGEIGRQDAARLIEGMRSHPQGFDGWKRDLVMGVMAPKDQFDAQDKNRRFTLEANNQLIGPDGKVNQPLLGAQVTKATAGRPVTKVEVNTGQKGLDNEFKLRGEFKQEPVYKAHQEMQAAHAQIRQSIAQGTPIGDTAAATKIMKLLDPGSVVRESELGIAMASTGLLDRATNYAQNVLSGNKLTPKQRQEFLALADQLLNESTSQYNTKRSEYQRLGGEYGLNADRALGPDARSAGGKPNASGGLTAAERAELAELRKRFPGGGR